MPAKSEKNSKSITVECKKGERKSACLERHARKAKG
jgi:hypothetical protein